jgi:hypothetical protein
MAGHVKAWGSHCMACHDGTDRFSPERFSHDSTRFALTGAHERLDCAGCHQGARAVVDLRGASRECVGCHQRDDAHRGDYGTDCRACHGTVAWKPTSFRHSFPQRECVGCHQRDDAHRGDYGADCKACHGTEAWKPTSFRHRFPIAHGRRGSAACTTCHEPGRKFSEYTCYGCHEHTPARIAGKHSEEGVSGARLDDCVRCHATGREKEGEGGEGEGREHGDREHDD